MSDSNLPNPMPASEPGGIVGLGLVVVDFLSVLDAYPRVDSKQDVTESWIQVGGPVPTALAQLTRYGHQCQFISCWGDDLLGDEIEANLKQTGISHTDLCRRTGMTSGHSQVWIERSSGKRTSVTRRPDGKHLVLTDSDRAMLQRAAVLHLDGWPGDVALEAAEIVKFAGGRIVLDTGSPKPGIDALLRVADVVNAPRRFVEDHLKVSDLFQGARALLKAGPCLVTVTDGDAGAVLVTPDQSLHVSALRLPRVIDTNGAGDVFSAGIIHGVVRDWATEKTLRFATAAAGLKCESAGNRSALQDEHAAQQASKQLVSVDFHD